MRIETTLLVIGLTTATAVLHPQVDFTLGRRTVQVHKGAQVSLGSIGELGQGRPELGRAYDDRRSDDWFGVLGNVKTARGLDGVFFSASS